MAPFGRHRVRSIDFAIDSRAVCRPARCTPHTHPRPRGYRYPAGHVVASALTVALLAGRGTGVQRRPRSTRLVAGGRWPMAWARPRKKDKTVECNCRRAIILTVPRASAAAVGAGTVQVSAMPTAL
jgi:hypothetical protein